MYEYIGKISVVTRQPTFSEMHLVWMVFLGCLQHQVKAQRPAIVKNFLPQIKKVGETAYMNCTVTNKGPNSVVSWMLFMPGDKIPIFLSINTELFTGDNRHDVQAKQNALGTTYTLIIRSVAEQDAGDYMCRVKIPGVTLSEWPRKRVKLTVQFAPRIKPSMKSLYEVGIGSNLQMNCEARGVPSPNITWTREDGRTLSTGRLEAQGAQLTLTAIQKSDRGYYICEANNGIKPPASIRVKVAVYFPPLLTPVQSVVGQAQNRRFDAKLECIVAGNPRPTVKWMKEAENGRRIELKDNDKYDITKEFNILQNDEFWSTLHVKNVQANDYTKYYCVGHNRYGNGEASITLIETTECQGPNCPGGGLTGA
ncbi:lachesin-like [Saccostrea echinata]|uniref:lachesin-like n=1 Tax=Saccostrea echinata TaxID=191078 RepID=UPI002A7ED734|nr:lachesin-like [Saccostrea echinata]